jgi:chromate reductase, NAD(P)H dehydrogenase (quinone)
MNICIISGSARKNNNTIRVAYALQNLLNGEHTVSIIDFVAYDIPLLPQGDLIEHSLTPFQSELMESMHKAHIVVLISPEYNWSTTPEILNMLHRLGTNDFKHVFDETVFALIGVSSGKGGKAPALHLSSILSKIISFMDLESIISPKLFESHYTKEVLDEKGHSLGNKAYDAGLKDFTDYTLRVANRWFN